MPPLMRRAPLSERIKAYVDPHDWLLWLAEELNDDAYAEWLQVWATPIGVGTNIVFILARGASAAGARFGQGRGGDDVFGDSITASGFGWFGWLASFVVHSLTLACCLNAFYVFFRKRHYRLFEQPVDIAPHTPSAHRVRVDSSPMSSSPMRYFHTALSEATASARAHPDPQREVWELRVWDPNPFNLSLFTLFSPGHVLLYRTLLPPAPLDPRPSVAVATAIAFAALLSLQLNMLRFSFAQQAKDRSLVHGEVMNEYDTKFVRPSLNRPVRDVGIQTPEPSRRSRTREVDVYTPTTIVNRGFRTNPNPNYARLYDPDNLSTESLQQQQQPAGPLNPSSSNPSLHSNPTANGTYASPKTQIQSLANGHTISSRPSTSDLATAGAGGGARGEENPYSSPLKPHHERPPRDRDRDRDRVVADQRHHQTSRGTTSGGGGGGDGGSFGIYTHPASPLKKSLSNRGSGSGSGNGNGTADHPAFNTAQSRPGGSPLKRAASGLYYGGQAPLDPTASSSANANAARRRQTESRPRF